MNEVNHSIPALARLAVLISGNGSNLQSILDACASGSLPAHVILVVSNKANAYGIERASRAGIPAITKSRLKDQDRIDYDHQLAKLVIGYRPDWIILAGWMRILTNTFLDEFPGRVINLHPALPGMFPGTHAIEHALDAYRIGEIQHTGVMVHLVPDQGVDNGPVLGQAVVPIFQEDTLETLEARVHQVEHQLLVETLSQVIQKPLVETRNGR
jgi:formyltetrahydrofolate-dependent phosphoribosylglycinamide formyltransferase